MRCEVCEQLQEAVVKAQKPDMPEFLVGLTEAGIRNRTSQRQEKVVKTETDLKKHKHTCLKRDREDDAAF